IFLQNKTNEKIISFLMIILVLMPVVFLSMPRQAEAFSLCPPGIPDPKKVSAESNEEKGSTALTCLTTIKEWVQKTLEIALMAIARQVIAQMTQSIINWINSGFHGSPTFLENPESFFKDIVKYEIRTMVDQLGYDLRRFPFGQAWALNTIGAYKSTLENNAAHSLSGVMNQQQIANYMDFNVGGWDSFFLKTQFPQNNYIGFQMMANESLSAQLAGAIKPAAEQVQSLLQQGQGFLSPEKCMDEGTNYNNIMANAWNRPSFDRSTVPYTCGEGCPLVGPPAPGIDMATCDACRVSYNAALAAAEADWAKDNTCKNLVKTTPGTIVADQLKISLGSSRRMIELSTALGSSISAIIDALLNKLIGEGLNAMADTISSEPPEDNWTYNGISLDGNGSDTTGPGPLNIPQNVSLRVGETTSVTITGGKPEYSVKITDPVTPDTTIATAGVTGDTLTIAGMAPGQTSVTVKDSRADNPRKVLVAITVVNSDGLMAVPASITTTTGGTVVVTISGGTEPYRMSAEPNQTIAVASFSVTKLIISGLGAGQTSATITDSSGRIVTVSITVVAPTALGTCTLTSGEIIQDISETACTAQGGTWTEPGSQTTGLTVDLIANKTDIARGESVELTWNSTGASSCDASWTNSSATSGTETKSPENTRTYIITCSDSSGASSADLV